MLMFFYALSLRVGKYGFTENRYYGLLLGIWLLFSLGYFIVKKGKDTILLAILLCLMTLVGTFGPFSGVNIGKGSQIKRLTKMLKENQALKNNAIDKNSNLDGKEKEEVIRILEYLSQRQALGEVEYLPKDFKLANTKAVFGFSEEFEATAYNGVANYTFKEQGMDIKGYDTIYFTQVYDGFQKLESGPFTIKEKDQTIEIYGEQKDGEPIFRFNVVDLNNKITALEKTGIQGEELTLTKDVGGKSYKLIFSFINLYKNLEREDAVITYNMEWYLLEKTNKDM